MAQHGLAQNTAQTTHTSRRRRLLFVGLALAAVVPIVAKLIHYYNPTRTVDGSSIFAWTTFVLSFYALIIAINTDSAAAESLDSINAALIGIEMWAKAMTTRHVGPFPDHLDEITNLISATQDGGTLDIIADCADYGSFYDPQKHKNLQAAMSSARSRNVTIRYVACGTLHRFTANSPYFGKKTSELSSHEREAFVERLRNFLNLVLIDSPFLDKLIGCLENPTQMDALVEWLTDNTKEQEGQPSWHTECINLFSRLCNKNDVTSVVEMLLSSERQLDLLLFIREWSNESLLRCVAEVVRDRSRAPMFLWLRDAKTSAEAVFVFPSPVTRGFGFKTLDSVLISSFASTFDYYWPPSRM